MELKNKITCFLAFVVFMFSVSNVSIVHAEDTRTVTYSYNEMVFYGNIQFYTVISSYTGPPYFVWNIFVSDKPFMVHDKRFDTYIPSHKSKNDVYFYLNASSPSGSPTVSNGSPVIDLSATVSYNDLQTNESIRNSLIDNYYFDISYDSYLSEQWSSRPGYVTDNKVEYEKYMKENYPDLFPEDRPSGTIDYEIDTFKFIDKDNDLSDTVRFALLYNLILAYFIWDVAKFIVIRVFNILKKWGYKNVGSR